MGFLDICCSCCSGNTVDKDEFPRAHITRAQPRKAEDETPQPVEPIDLTGTEPVDDVVEDASPAPSVSPQGSRTLATRRHVKDCKLKSGRHKIQLTGAVAAVPPCSAAECVGEVPKVSSSKVALGDGAYLVYSQEQNGSLNFAFKKQAPGSLDGVLAYIKPRTEFASYRYTDDNGCELAATNLQRTMQSQYVSDRKPFYESWCKFLKLTTSVNGTLYLLEASELSPPPKAVVLLYKDGALTPAQSGVPIELRDYSMVGVLPPAFDYNAVADVTERLKFTSLCDEHGASLAL
ncbi:uncharacterized protein BcabD6B2_35440 [Babesia caballi]|uniref:Immune mapped protein 2 N-terminal domain-containing protein n=1 Tax=Babesia caballi TaxID=5871 RepID=A0AAV4M003_BABCB|nr:hypothetical protein BcabD6B2_35440 [Babesia caballi]